MTERLISHTPLELQSGILARKLSVEPADQLDVRLAVQPGAPLSRSASSTIRPSGPRTQQSRNVFS